MLGKSWGKDKDRKWKSNTQGTPEDKTKDDNTNDQTHQRYHHFYSTHSPSFSKPGAYVTHDATHPLCDITGGIISDYVPERKRKNHVIRLLTLCKLMR